MECELHHAGVKGMRWGIRRYQNKDGSLTPAGKKRYAKQQAKEAKENETKEAKKERVLKSRSAKELYDNADLFTTQELKSAYNRLQLERNIKNLQPSEVSRGRAFVDKSIAAGDKMSEVLTIGSKLYNNIASIYNSLTESGRANPLPKIGNPEGKKKDGDGGNDNKGGKNNNDKGGKGNSDKNDSSNGQASSGKNAGSNNQTRSNSRNDRSDRETVYEGEVSGTGSSRRAANNSSTSRSNRETVIDADFVDLGVSDVPSSTVSRGQSFIAGLLEEPKR